MRSLHVRLTIRLALGTLLVLSCALLASNLYAMHRVTQQSKRYLRGIARSILDAVTTTGAAGQALPDQVTASIEEHFAFVDRQREMAFAILTADGRELYRSKGFTVPIGPKLLRGDRTQLHLVGVRSGSELTETFSVWHFVYRHEAAGFIVLVCDSYQFEVVERLAQGTLVAALVAILLALPLGYAASRRVLRPFHAIDDAAAKVRQGQLATRIPAVTKSPEVMSLINALNATFAELETSFRRIEQFSADAAHELRTPLTALRGNLEVCLARERDVSEYQAVLAESIREVSLLSGMVQDLLLLATPGATDRRALFTTVDIGAVALETVERLDFVADESRVRLVTDVAPGMQVPGDTKLLQRALYNLVHNAIRYSSPDTQVRVSACRVADAVMVEVADQGIGIPKDKQKDVFERFYRLDASRSQGAGLGLSMVKWVVELHGGHVELDSDSGRGSRFRMVLPAPRG